MRLPRAPPAGGRGVGERRKAPSAIPVVGTASRVVDERAPSAVPRASPLNLHSFSLLAPVRVVPCSCAGRRVSARSAPPA